MRSGEIDLAYASLGDIEAFVVDAKFNTSRMEVKINLMLMFNTKMLDDPNLRNAITHVIDPAFINKAIYFGQNTAADSGMWLPGRGLMILQFQDHRTIQQKPKAFEESR